MPRVRGEAGDAAPLKRESVSSLRGKELARLTFPGTKNTHKQHGVARGRPGQTSCA